MTSRVSDTIVAPATGPGRSALAVVRLDGPDSHRILEAVAGEPGPVRHATLSVLRDALGDVIDEAVVVRYQSPYSYTGNDLVEFSLHGNPYLSGRLIRRCLELGARMAEAGEFTERAVLNGKIDLVQAESVGDLISARTSLQAKLALGNLRGELGSRAVRIRRTLLEVISLLEAGLDFSEEGYEFIARADARGRMEGARGELDAMLATFARGKATTEGLTVVILGLPNSGKSSLLNALVGSERAIVTKIPGTTRDVVRETLDLGGVPVTFADTAGLRLTTDQVEQIGVERAREAGVAAGLILYLVDSAAGITDEDRQELARIEGRDLLLVYSKRDLAKPPADGLSISTVSPAGVEDLLRWLEGWVRERTIGGEDAGVLVNERQHSAAMEGRAAVDQALAALDANFEDHVVLVDLYRASAALASLVGAIARDDIYTEIFSKFCIGK